MSKLPDEILAEISWEELARELWSAEVAYGCGFYNNERWLAAYAEIKRRSGLRQDEFTGELDHSDLVND